MDWVALFISIISVAVAVVVPVLLLQALKPHVEVSYDSYSGRSLMGLIQNTPTNNPILKMIGKDRDSVESLTISISISDKSGTWNKEFNGFVDGDMQNRVLDFNCKKETDIRLPASKLRAGFYIAREQNEQVFFVDANGGNGSTLPPGIYKMELELYVDGKRDEIVKDFKVNAHEPWLEWIEEDVKT